MRLRPLGPSHQRATSPAATTAASPVLPSTAPVASHSTPSSRCRPDPPSQSVAGVTPRPTMTRSAGTCVTKFADYQLGLYATADYLAMHGRITGLANLHEHTLIGYVDAVLEVLPLRILDELVPEKRAQIQTNNITGQWLAASASLGVAALPVYTGDADRRLVRVLADTVTVNRTYWLVVPRDIRRLARVRAVVEILRGIAATHRGLLTPGSLPEIHSGP